MPHRYDQAFTWGLIISGNSSISDVAILTQAWVRADVRRAIVAMLGAGLLCAAAGKARSAPLSPGQAEAGTFDAALTGRRSALVQTTHRGRIVAGFVEGAGGVDHLTYDIGLSAGTQVTYVTLQCAPAGSFGPVVAVLTEAKGWVADRHQLRRRGAIGNTAIVPTTVTATCPVAIRSLEDVRAAALRGAIYVNVYAYAYPAGELRGQLRPRQR